MKHRRDVDATISEANATECGSEIRDDGWCRDTGIDLCHGKTVARMCWCVKRLRQNNGCRRHTETKITIALDNMGGCLDWSGTFVLG